MALTYKYSLWSLILQLLLSKLVFCSTKTYSIKFLDIDLLQQSQSVPFYITNGSTIVLQNTATPTNNIFNFDFDPSLNVSVQVSVNIVENHYPKYNIYDQKDAQGLEPVYESLSPIYIIPNTCTNSFGCVLTLEPLNYPTDEYAFVYLNNTYDDPVATSNGSSVSANISKNSIIIISVSSSRSEFQVDVKISDYLVSTYYSRHLATSVILPVTLITSPSPDSIFKVGGVIPIKIGFVPLSTGDFWIAIFCSHSSGGVRLGEVSANLSDVTNLSIPTGNSGTCIFSADNIDNRGLVTLGRAISTIIVDIYVIQFKFVPVQIANEKSFELLIATVDGSSLPEQIVVELICEGLSLNPTWSVTANLRSTLNLNAAFSGLLPYSCTLQTESSDYYNQISSPITVLISMNQAQQSVVGKKLAIPPGLIFD